MASNGLAIGIDLGTSTSCVAVFRDGKVEVIPNRRGNRTIPSYVAFTETGRLVGDAAKKQSRTNPSNTLFGVTRLLGRKFDDPAVQSDTRRWPFGVMNDEDSPTPVVEYKGEATALRPEEVAAILLSRMKQMAEAHLGGQAVSEAVIAIPAYYNNAQRQATKDAAAIAGLNVLRLVHAPTAAAIAYHFSKKCDVHSEDNVLVFDMGGGSLDVSVVTIENNGTFEVKSMAGDTHLGGMDFDNRVMDYLLNILQNKYFRQGASEEVSILSRVRLASEEAKKTLSTAPKAIIGEEKLFGSVDFCTTISRDRFENLNADLFQNVLRVIQKSLGGMVKSQITDILLVGASSRIPKIQELLREFCEGAELDIGKVDPEEAVASGAAFLANDLGKELLELDLFDITPFSLGIDPGDGRMSTVIQRHTFFPTTRTQTYSTFLDNQTEMLLEVYEGEQAMTKDNHLLGKFRLTGLPLLPKGVPRIKVTFAIDMSGILNLSAIEMSTESDITITNYGDSMERLSSEELGRLMVLEAERSRDDNVSPRDSPETLEPVVEEDAPLDVALNFRVSDSVSRQILESMARAFQAGPEYISDEDDVVEDDD